MTSVVLEVVVAIEAGGIEVFGAVTADTGVKVLMGVGATILV